MPLCWEAMDSQLSPEVVEALAKSLAGKLAATTRAGENLADVVATLEKNQAKILIGLELVQKERLFLHYSAVLCAIVAIVIATLGMFGDRRSNQRLLEEIQQLKTGQAKLRHVPAAPSR
jgi:hypothetical protein